MGRHELITETFLIITMIATTILVMIVRTVRVGIIVRIIHTCKNCNNCNRSIHSKNGKNSSRVAGDPGSPKTEGYPFRVMDPPPNPGVGLFILVHFCDP